MLKVDVFLETESFQELVPGKNLLEEAAEMHHKNTVMPVAQTCLGGQS